jgi:hypothetical protein
MFAKIYWYTWLVIGAVAGLMYVTGNLSTLAIVVFEFIAFGMTFMGMMNVLPFVVTHIAPESPVAKREEKQSVPVVSVSIPSGARSVRV